MMMKQKATKRNGMAQMKDSVRFSCHPLVTRRMKRKAI
ncbi:hypothetical protein LptCag_0581 [Leptospirillum ferriphilum]|uniref:Uncharacterized protein n=1 Tax=Leptospirillum ferriphilum TaxID=178606 RepID=A0A094WBS1_9BACT|nr:hypothetical protein LptCag_0581 [Leptospirillum ferriphilum]